MRKMRKILLTLVLVCGTALLVCGKAEAAVSNFHYKYTALDGSKVSTKADSNGKILIYLRTDGQCMNSISVMNRLCNDPVEGAVILAVDGDSADRETVEAFAAERSSEQITYAYGSSANDDMWNYAEVGGFHNSLTFPLIVYIDGNDKIQAVTSGKATAEEIAERYEKCMNPTTNPVDPTEKVRGLDVDKHTVGEIRDYITNSISMLYYEDEFETQPVITGAGAAGELTDESKALALAMLNQIRYIAGLDANVQLYKAYEDAAQAGAVITYMNYKTEGKGFLSHNPGKPDGVDEDLYELGYTGCSRSNLASGFLNLSAAIVYGWMDDSDGSNIDAVGHRRWLLHPEMGYTGFGACSDSGSSRDIPVQVAYAFDKSNTEAKQTLVAWPAQYTPTFCWSGTAWSLTTGVQEDILQVQVQVTSLNDGTVWNLSANSTDGYFNVNNRGYGDPGCIIFAPRGFEAEDGDCYKVHISGLNGDDIEYTVTFFDYNRSESVVADDGTIGSSQDPDQPHVHTPVDIPAVKATCKESGWTKGSRCSECGEILTAQKEIPALGHDFYVTGTECIDCEEGIRTYYSCSRCNATKTKYSQGMEHTWDEGVVIEEPTVAAKGKIIYVCEVCYATKVKAIPTLPAKVTWSSTALKNTAGGIKLSWKANKDADGYYVYRSKDGGSYEKVLKVKGGSASSWIDESALDNGSCYTYKIYAYKSSGGRNYKGPASSKAVIYRISRPKISSLKNISSRKMVLTWSKNSKATGYEIQYAANSKFTSAKSIKIKGYKNVSETIGSLSKGKTYYVRLRTWKKVDSKTYYSDWSPAKKIKISR
ncbi:MAG: fibronectin type III domain-containing protein [Clostridiales bacterium]|nr:fibronectin type III domain-containing protein [Clostridiales bacterium]